MFDHMAMWIWPDAVEGEPAERIVARLREARIDTLIPYIGLRADAARRAAYEERIRALIAEARRYGLAVIACYDEMVAHDGMPVTGCCQVREDEQGDRRGLLCPAHPVARDYILGELDRVLRTFHLDGINLEDSYVYNSTTVYDPAHSGGTDFRVIPVCCCDHCRAHAPIGKPEWQRWKIERLTELVAAQSALIRSRRPGISFSVAARMPYARDDFYAPYRDEIPYYSGWRYCQSRDGMAADWVDWLRRGLIDFACPMSYFHTARLVELQTLECRHRVPEAARSIWMGLGRDVITAEYSQGRSDQPDGRHDDALRNDAAAIRLQLDLQARLGQRNVVFFSQAFLKDEHIPAIAAHGHPREAGRRK